MKRLGKPDLGVVDVLEIIKGETTRVKEQNAVDSAVDILKEREDLYKDKVINNTLYQIPKLSNISHSVDAAKMENYYSYNLMHDKKPNGRTFYNKILQSAPYNICPYCTMQSVKTIDHFLPKNDYPSYSITPLNLVPSCRDCNLEKRTNAPVGAEDQTFHPYFDVVDDRCWIKAVLMATEPLSFQFEVIQPDGWSDNLFKRAKTHFKSYNINELFSTAADRALRGTQQRLKELFRDKTTLKEHLEASYHSNQDGLGILDWKTLMYKELSTNEWFLNGCIGNNFFN